MAFFTFSVELFIDLSFRSGSATNQRRLERLSEAHPVFANLKTLMETLCTIRFSKFWYRLFEKKDLFRLIPKSLKSDQPFLEFLRENVHNYLILAKIH